MQDIIKTVNFLKNRGITSPQIGIVLGTGLGQMVREIEIEQTIPYSDIPNFPLSTVEMHNGNLIYGNIGDKKVLAMQGRFHFYEGYNMQQIVFPIRVMRLLGIQFLLLSNIAGGINLDLKKGDLVMIGDHINLQPTNPLTGVNNEKLGSRFPDMSKAYSPYINEKLKNVAQQNKIQLKQGIYVSVTGPSLETPAEYRFLKIIGADMVGMSTVPEVIAANHMRLPCAAVSVITDECNPDNLQPIDVAEIIEIAGKADKKLSALYSETIKQL